MDPGVTHLLLKRERRAQLPRAPRRFVGVVGTPTGCDASLRTVSGDEGARIARTDARTAEAYERIFHAQYAHLARLASLLGAADSDIEDFVTETFVRVYPLWLAGRVETVDRYLRVSLANLLRAERRHLAVRLRRLPILTHRQHIAPIDDTAAARQTVLHALNSLSTSDRLIVVLRYCEDMSEAETAAVLDLPVGTVKSRAARALQRLRPLLTERSDR